MARLQDYQSVTPSSSNDDLLIVQATGQGLAKIDAVGQKIANDTTISSLSTTSKKIAGAINELDSLAASKSLTSVTHAKYRRMTNGLVFIIVDGATNGETLNIPAPSSTQYFAGLSQSNAYCAFSLSAARKVTIITSGATAAYGNFVYYSG